MSGGSTRCGSIDWLRFVALFEIAAFHSQAGRVTWIAGLGLPLLLVITNIFNVRNAARRGTGAFVYDKLRRLLVPWLFWCALYAALAVVLALRRGSPPLTQVFSWRNAIAGTWPHLWFVPFAIFAGAAAAALRAVTRAWPVAAVIAGASFAGLALLVITTRFDDALWNLGKPVPEWAFSLPSVFFGFAVGSILLLPRGRGRHVSFALLALGSGALWALTLAFHGEWAYERYGAAIFLAVVALWVDVAADRVVSFLAPLTLGVYLSHALVIRVLIAAKVSWETSAAWAGATLALSVLLVWGMKRIPWLRRFV